MTRAAIFIVQEARLRDAGGDPFRRQSIVDFYRLAGHERKIGQIIARVRVRPRSACSMVTIMGLPF